MRLLFSSIDGLLDPSSGAAIATRELVELLSGRASECRAFTAGVLDDKEETSLDQALGALGLPAARFAADLGGGRAAEVIDVEAGRVRCTILATRSSRAERSPDREESASFLELATQVLDRFRPDALPRQGDERLQPDRDRAERPPPGHPAASRRGPRHGRGPGTIARAPLRAGEPEPDRRQARPSRLLPRQSGRESRRPNIDIEGGPGSGSAGDRQHRSGVPVHGAERHRRPGAQSGSSKARHPKWIRDATSHAPDFSILCAWPLSPVATESDGRSRSTIRYHIHAHISSFSGC